MSRAFGRKLAGVLLNLILVVLVGGFAAAALVRYSPGFDIDENAWNPKIGASTAAAMHARARLEARLPFFYAHYLSAAGRGDFGVSEKFNAPVSELLRERAPVSAKLIVGGTSGGMILGGCLAWIAIWPRRLLPAVFASAASGFFLALPPAVLALFFFFEEGPLVCAVSLAVMPRVCATLKTVFAELRDSPALLVARARGLSSARIALGYVLLPAMPHVVGIAGVALVLAFGCIIPIEALCNVPGIGQLAWTAALARDLPLLSALALIITFGVSAVHAVGELSR